MEKINLKEILEKHKYLVRVQTDSSNMEDPAINAMKEVWNLAVDKCKKKQKFRITNDNNSALFDLYQKNDFSITVDEIIRLNATIGHDKVSFQEGIRVGYKAAGGFSEEDMIAMAATIAGRYSIRRHTGEVGEGEALGWAKEFLKSLKKYPTSALVEMEVQRHPDETEKIKISYKKFVPKVDKNNHLIIKEFNYESN